MKRLTRLAIIGSIAYWLLFAGGWDQANRAIKFYQGETANVPKKRSETALKLRNAIRRNEDLSEKVQYGVEQ